MKSLKREFQRHTGHYFRNKHKQHNERTQLAGFGRSQASKAVWAERKVKSGIDNAVKSGIIKENIVIGRSLGAAAKNYPVRLPDGNHTKFAEGTEITKIKVFAGKGTDVTIRDAIFLENEYKIPANEWQKVRGEGVIVENGKNRTAEIHWYEAEGQKVKMKVKRYCDEG